MSSSADVMSEPDDFWLASEARSRQADMVTSADKWPVGLERQRPRFPQNPVIALSAFVGGGLGAMVAAALTQHDRDVAGNAALGAAAGAMAGGLGGIGITRAMSLDQSLRLALPKLGVTFVSLRQYGRYEARLVFETKTDGFKLAQANADPSRTWAENELDDWLYVKLVAAVQKNWKPIHEARRRTARTRPGNNIGVREHQHSD